MRDPSAVFSPPDFQELFQSGPALQLVLTPDFRIAAVSDAYLRATMTKRDEILNRTIFDVFPDNPNDPAATGVRNLKTSLTRVVSDRISDTMAIQKYDIRKPESEGGQFEERYWSPVNSPILGADKQVIYIIHRVEDVTEFVRLKQQGIEQEKQADEMRSHAGDMEAEIYLRAAEVQASNRRLEATNKELLAAKNEAERGSKFKDQFLSTMSHELRTPLNAVLGFSDLLADEAYGPLNERQRRYVSHIHTGGKHLLTLVSDILDLSKIEAGRLEITLENLAIETIFGEVLAVMRSLADRKGQVLAKSSLPEMIVRADSTRFKQVLMNLLGNAIKFTPKGGLIELGALVEDEKIRVQVRDNGPGIPLHEQQRIFEAFYRLRDSGEKTEGTGLGLAITYRLVELQGGILCLESEPGRGSCFHFALPKAVREFRAPKPAMYSRPAGLPHVLVIEDNSVAAQLIQTQLNSAGYEVTLCNQPQKALETAAQLQPGAITLDIVMKPRNGWEVLAQLKRDVRTARIPLIVVSIVDQPGMSALFGADEYLVKPVDKAMLLAALDRHIGTRPVEQAGPPVLVVEDDAATREFLAELLTAEGYSVATASDAAQARMQVAANLPKIAILDLVLPGVNGFQLLGEWRSAPRTSELPVFVLTSKDLSQEEHRYLRTHAEALLQKHQPWKEALVKQLERVAATSTPAQVTP